MSVHPGSTETPVPALLGADFTRDRVAECFWIASGRSRHGGPWCPGAKPTDSMAMADTFAFADIIVGKHERAVKDLVARLVRAEGDRDAMRQAIGFKPGPLEPDRDADIVIIDAKALRPAMVEARQALSEAQDDAVMIRCFAGEEVRLWVKERFGKWITYKSAAALVARIFDREAADGPKGQDGQLRDEPQTGEAA